MKRWRLVLIVVAALVQIIPVLLLPPELLPILVVISALLGWALLALRPVAATLAMVTLFSVDQPEMPLQFEVRLASSTGM